MDPSSTGPPRRRRRRLIVRAFLVILLAFVVFGAWAISWALTATPVGSAGLEDELAAAARWPDGPRPADGSGYERWAQAIAAHRALAEATVEDRPELVGTSLLALEAPDDSEPWRWILAAEAATGDANSAPARAVLRARADALRASTIPADLIAVARGPRPAITAEQAAAMGFGTRFPFAVVMRTLGESRDVAKDLMGLARLEAEAGNPSAVPPLLEAAEGLARGAEALPNLIHQLVSVSIRAMAWNTVAELAARGRLDAASLDAIDALMVDPADALPDGVRTARTFAGERALLTGAMGHLYDASGRALPASWDTLDPNMPFSESRMSNVMGLVMPRRATVERRLDEVIAGTGPPIASPGGIGFLVDPDLMAGLLSPAYDKARANFERVERMPAIGRVVLAVARHELEHGVPPASLDELGLPADAIRDPWGDRQLDYERLDPDASHRGLRWRIQSVGPDTGTPVDDLRLPTGDPS